MKKAVTKALPVFLFLVAAVMLNPSAGYAQGLEVINVPYVPGKPGIPHGTYNQVSTKFMAMARGGGGTYFYDWDFNGDGNNLDY